MTPKNTPFRSVIIIILLTTCIQLQSTFAQWERLASGEVLAKCDPVIEWSKYNDPDTGHEVWQMTSSDHGTWATHFNTQTMTPDDRYLVFSSNRTGSWQLFRVSLENGEIFQLTDVESLASSSFTIHPNGTDIYFGFDGKLGRVNLLTGQIHYAEFDVPVVFRRLISNDGFYSVVSHTHQGSSSIFLITLDGPEIQARLDWPRGSNIDTGMPWTGGISHTMMNPEYPWLVTFLPSSTYRQQTGYYDQQRDMSIPMKLRARAWIWDARTGEASPFVSAPNYFSYTHESWCWSGERFFLFQKSTRGWVPNHISSVDKNGENWTYHHSDDTLRLGHGASSRDGEWFISDGQDPDRNPLRLINLNTGKWEDICWPDAKISPGHAEQSHVHPAFSPSGNFVVYTSDRTGSSEAYVIRIPEEVKRELSKP